MGSEEEYKLVIDTILRPETGFFKWKDGVAERVVEETGMLIAGFNAYIRSCIKGGNKVVQKGEVRDDWKEDFRHTHQLILPLFTLFSHGYFVEFRLDHPRRAIVQDGRVHPDDVIVMGVSAHEEQKR